MADFKVIESQEELDSIIKQSPKDDNPNHKG